MGLVLTKEGVDSFKKFGQESRRLKDAGEGFKKMLAEGALPILSRLTSAIMHLDVKLVAFTQKHKHLTTAIIGGVASFAALLAVMGTISIVGGTVIKSVTMIGRAFALCRSGLDTLRLRYMYASDAIAKWGIANKIGAAWQWLLNTSLYGCPLIWIIGAIAALVAVVVVCWKKFAAFRAVIKTTWDVIKGFGSILKDYIIDRIKGIISGLGSMGRAIGLLFKGHFKEAAAEGLRGVKALSGYDARIKAASRAKSLVTSIKGDYQSHLAIEKAAQAKSEAKPAGGSTLSMGAGATSGMFQRMGAGASASTNATPQQHHLNRGDTHVTYAPVINISGGSPQDKDSFSRMLREHKRELEQMIKDIAANNARLSFNYKG